MALASASEARFLALSQRLQALVHPERLAYLEGEIAAIQKENEALLAQISAGAKSSAKLYPPLAVTHLQLPKASEWSTEYSFRLCDDGQTGPFKDKAHFMDKATVSSLRSAVEQLNAGVLHSSESWVAVFSERCKEWYVLFKPGLKEDALRHFGICDDSAHRVGKGSPASPARQARIAACLPSTSIAPRPALGQWDSSAQQDSPPQQPAGSTAARAREGAPAGQVAREELRVGPSVPDAMRDVWPSVPDAMRDWRGGGGGGASSEHAQAQKVPIPSAPPSEPLVAPPLVAPPLVAPPLVAPPLVAPPQQAAAAGGLAHSGGVLGSHSRRASPADRQMRTTAQEVDQLEAMTKELATLFAPRGRSAEPVAAPRSPSGPFHPSGRRPHGGPMASAGTSA